MRTREIKPSGPVVSTIGSIGAPSTYASSPSLRLRWTITITVAPAIGSPLRLRSTRDHGEPSPSASPTGALVGAFASKPAGGAAGPDASPSLPDCDRPD